MFNFNKDSTFLFLKTGLDQTQSTVIGKVLKKKKKKKKKKQGSGGLGNRLSLLKENISLVVRNPVFCLSDLFRHKPGCTATEDSQSLEISDLGSRWVGLRLCFRIFKNPVFLLAAHIAINENSFTKGFFT